MQTLKERTIQLQPIGQEEELTPEEQAQIEQLEQKMYDPVCIFKKWEPF